MVLPVALSACESAEPSASSAEIFCAGMCARATECGGWRHVSLCELECEEDPPRLEDYRPEFVTKFAACFQRLSCDVYFNDGSFDPCWDEARDGFEPNAATRTFCADRSRTWFECGFSYFPDECERDWAICEGTALNRVAECHRSATCDKLESCTEAAFKAGQ